MVVWPVYIAVVLPGLPWLTPTRMALFVVTFFFLYSVATSSAAAPPSLGSSRASCKPLWIAFLLWEASMFVSLAVFAPHRDDAEDPARQPAAPDRDFLPRLPDLRATRSADADDGDADRPRDDLRGRRVHRNEARISAMGASHPQLHAGRRCDDGQRPRVAGAVGRRLVPGARSVPAQPRLRRISRDVHAVHHPLDRHRRGRCCCKLAMVVAWVMVMAAIVITHSRLGLVGALLAHVTYLPLWAFRRWRAEPQRLPRAVRSCSGRPSPR